MNDVMLSVCVLSYNHERYLRQCLDGIFMQKVSFPIEVRVHDDASTDKSQDIIREYQERHPNILKPILQSENQYSKGGGVLAKFLLPLCEGKYIALCEGDDYWTDPLKLQKQVDYMEAHDKCSCCAHNSLRLNTNTRQIGLFNKKILQTKDYSLETFITRDWFTPTQSLLYRRASYQTFEDMLAFMHGDYSLLINVLLTSGSYLHYENEIMAVYRDGGFASTHYKECDLYNDFVLLLEFYKQKSNHRCDAVFDRQIERQKLEKERYLKYQKDYKKTHSLLVRVGHWVCRAIASVVNKYVPCIHVTKKLEFEAVPNLEQID